MAFNVQKITTTNKTEVTFKNHKSMIFTNNHATDAVTIDLYATSQVGTDITSTTVLAAETEAASTSSVALTVDTVNATDDVFLNERVYKSDGSFFGVCTTVNSTTLLTFSGGLDRAITNNDILHTGTRYHFLNNVKIPNGTSLKLTEDEFHMNTTNYKLYINTDSSTGGIDIITRY
tara:strand:+ start:213 stop:740 length:528 start_codon:yes stop_codon:yes gene_type:complete